MKITVRKLTDETLLREACDATRHPGQNASTATLKRMYQCQHSPARTQMFWVRMEKIATFVSVHFTRHKTGVEHFVESNRDDRGTNAVADRNTPVNHSMLMNAQALMTMADQRLCFQAHLATVGVMVRLKNAIAKVDPDLAELMVPKCVRMGFCPELKPCVAGPATVIGAYRNSWFVKEREKLREKSECYTCSSSA